MLARKARKSASRFNTKEAVKAPAINGLQPKVLDKPQNGLPAEPFDLKAKVKELLRLAQEQGYLTYDDINNALPEEVTSPDELDEVFTSLRNLDIQIVDSAEAANTAKQPQPEAEGEEPEKGRLDYLDDPVQ